MRCEKCDEKKEVKKVLEIDFKKMEEGVCYIEELSTGDKWAICKDEGKIKIFPIKEKEKER